ncbi:hypothetical protein [Streptomyces sp. NPDC001889]
MTIAECADAGQQTIEHLHALLLAGSADEQRIREGLAKVRLDPAEPSSLARYRSWFHQVHTLEHEAVRGYHRDRARRLFDRLAARGTHVVPTLSVHHRLERPDEIPGSLPEAGCVPSWLVESWPATWEGLIGGRTPQEEGMLREIHDHRLLLSTEQTDTEQKRS